MAAQIAHQHWPVGATSSKHRHGRTDDFPFMADTLTIDTLAERVANLVRLVERLETKLDEVGEELAELRGQLTARPAPAAALAAPDAAPGGDWLSRAPNRGQLLIGLITALGVFVPVLVAIANAVFK